MASDGRAPIPPLGPTLGETVWPTAWLENAKEHRQKRKRTMGTVKYLFPSKGSSQNVILFELSVYFGPLISIRLLGYRCSTFEPVAAVSPLMPLARENCEASHVFRQDRLLCWLISECHILGYGEFEMNMQHCLKTHETDMSEFDQSSKTQILNIPRIHPFRAQIGSRMFSRMVSKHDQRPMLRRVACPRL